MFLIEINRGSLAKVSGRAHENAKQSKGAAREKADEQV